MCQSSHPHCSADIGQRQATSMQTGCMANHKAYKNRMCIASMHLDLVVWASYNDKPQYFYCFRGKILKNYPTEKKIDNEALKWGI